jgi:hypothetical protein
MWLAIDNQYSVSDDGLVMNHRTGRILRPEDDRRGYERVSLWGRHQKVHRLVAQRFLPAPTDENVVVDHIDRNRMNNNVSNLRWVSHRENSRNRSTSSSVPSGP